MADYSTTSPYATTPIINEDYLDILEPRTIPITENDLPYTIESNFHQRPDTAAYVIYGSAKLWWVFAQRNVDVLKDPVFDFKAGTEIYISEPKKLFEYLGL